MHTMLRSDWHGQDLHDDGKSRRILSINMQSIYYSPVLLLSFWSLAFSFSFYSPKKSVSYRACAKASFKPSISSTLSHQPSAAKCKLGALSLFLLFTLYSCDYILYCMLCVYSYMEIYNEVLRDLLDVDFQKIHSSSSCLKSLDTTGSSSSMLALNNGNHHHHHQTNGSSSSNGGGGGGRLRLKIREHPTKGVYVQHLNQTSVSDLATTMKYVSRGNQNRSTASTHIHVASSRSHSIFTMTLTQAKVENDIPVEIVSKLNLVDLAGSERASADIVYNKKQLKEGANINKSLVSLGNVISILAERSLSASAAVSLSSSTSHVPHFAATTTTTGLNSTHSSQSNELASSGLATTLHNNNNNTTSTTNNNASVSAMGTFVPYRDSLLTHLLKDSLGGNSKTHMIAST